MSDEAKVLRVGNILLGPNGECQLVGNLNDLGGVCDDCRHDAVGYMGDKLEPGWSVVGNVYDQLAPRWIPVTERLPESVVDVAVYLPRYGEVMPLYYSARWDEWCDGHGFSCGIAGTMWQPLPEPPKP